MNMRQRKRALYVRNYHELLVAEILAELEDAANLLLESLDEEGQTADQRSAAERKGAQQQ
ncbi:hypothetical protein SAMN06265795_10484 [Noviherbaspirillum humi]|uniref:Uncharacterized protein n=1 Tax=Noviherbaspirillum humi TaxID=1688639 RepID=A0A239FV39_9BURK|nr:hypothetical protein [Noviherbaspirillum humi]SNS60002.1 hypothetical protein SAMN06265795_10484 [Noviherbaspirillum humi]